MESQADEHKAPPEVQQLIDRYQISELIYQYSYTWDGKDPEGLAAIFTEDTIWEWQMPGKAEPVAKIETREKFKNWAAERFTTNLADRVTRHYQTNPIFLELTETTAKTRVMILVTHAVKGAKAPVVAVSGTYEDTFKKTPEGWLISHRLLLTDMEE